ncbi:type II/IV secretion system protein [Melittangium boletus]|uniref:ATPase n=1 Tax=Melittangium boletus DSM 14713 TaxID=1294270 RepID=A0A250IPW3_9BACT|nr:type II/IV secretion system protein [Melittangium boletus]ATB33799.1 ATPase [Melittangium boletus DSM 14713]
MRKKRLGDLLRERELVDGTQLRAALGVHHKWGVPLGQVVVDLGFCTAQQVLALMAEQAQLPTVDLDAEVLDRDLVDVLPVHVAESCRVIPLRQEGPRDSVLVVATEAPGDPLALDEVARVTGKARVVSVLATDASISQAIERLYYPHLVGAKRPVEPIELPEAEEALPLVHGRAECLMLDGLLQRQSEMSVEDGHGLPVMKPLTDELPLDARLTEREMPRVLVALPRKTREPEVWVYGWGSGATRGLMRLLEESGLRARVARTEDVRKAGERTVVLTPLQSIESVKRKGVRARLVVAGRGREAERARELGAHSFLSGPLCADALIDTLREHLAAGHETPSRRAG